MKTRALTVALAAVLGGLAGAGGCADNRASVQIQMICQPSADCTYDSGKCPSEAAGYPTIDRSYATAGSTLGVFLQVANQLPNNADITASRVNTNDAHLDELDVKLEGAVSGEYTVGANGRIPTSGSSVVAVPVYLGTAGDGEVLARIRMRGYYDDSSRFETGEFPITIGVCTGCLPALCAAGAKTCPQDSEGQRPLECESSTTTP